MPSTALKQRIEALIFAAGDPLESERICDVLECGGDDVAAAVAEINKRLEADGSPLKIVALDSAYQYTTKPDFAPEIRKMLEIQRNTPLSTAAFEVLAVVAYNQPVTKAFIEQVRGVDCSGVVSSLVEKGLIEERGRLELPGRPLIYGTTKQFLRCFGLKSLDELPPLPEKEAPDEAPSAESSSDSAADNGAGDAVIDPSLSESASV